MCWVWITKSEEKKYAYDAEGNFKEDVVQTYLDSTGHPLTKSLATSSVGLSGTFLRVKKTRRGRRDLPLSAALDGGGFEERQMVSTGGPPPPGKETGSTAGVYHKFGKGQVVYLGVPLFEALHGALGAVVFDRRDRFWIRKWVPRLVRQLVPHPIAELESKVLGEFVSRYVFLRPEPPLCAGADSERDRAGHRGAVRDRARSADTPQSAEAERCGGACGPGLGKQDLEVVSRDGKLHVAVPRPERYTERVNNFETLW